MPETQPVQTIHIEKLPYIYNASVHASKATLESDLIQGIRRTKSIMLSRKTRNKKLESPILCKSLHKKVPEEKESKGKFVKPHKFRSHTEFEQRINPARIPSIEKRRLLQNLDNLRSQPLDLGGYLILITNQKKEKNKKNDIQIKHEEVSLEYQDRVKEKFICKRREIPEILRKKSSVNLPKLQREKPKKPSTLAEREKKEDHQWKIERWQVIDEKLNNLEVTLV